MGGNGIFVLSFLGKPKSDQGITLNIVTWEREGRGPHPILWHGKRRAGDHTQYCDMGEEGQGTTPNIVTWGRDGRGPNPIL